MYEDGKQFAEAPESSAAWMEVGRFGSVSVVQKVTLLDDFTLIAFAVFKMDVGAFVPTVDRDDVDDPAVVTVDECFGFKQKPEVGARL